MNQLELMPRTIPEHPQMDRPYTLRDLVEDFDAQLLIPPPHQRSENRWGRKKKEAWVNRLKAIKGISERKFILPVGSIVTYQLPGGGIRYINDGLQRLSTLSEFLKHPVIYGVTPEDSVMILKAISILVQHRIYDTHTEAMLDFQLLNIGTPLTQFELLKGIVEYAKSDRRYIEEILIQNKDTIDKKIFRICDPRRTSEETDQKFTRHNYALWYKFLTKDKSLKPVKITNTKQTFFDEQKARASVEYKLVEQIKIHDRTTIEKSGLDFRTFIEQESENIFTVWHKTINIPSAVIDINLFRWLLDVAIYKKFNLKSGMWNEFLQKLFKETRGKKDLYVARLKSSNRPLLPDRTGELRYVCEVIKLDAFIEKKSEKTKSKKGRRKELFKAARGADQGHLVPEGDYTIPQSVMENRSLGANPIPDQDIPDVVKEILPDNNN